MKPGRPARRGRSQRRPSPLCEIFGDSPQNGGLWRALPRSAELPAQEFREKKFAPCARSCGRSAISARETRSTACLTWPGALSERFRAYPGRMRRTNVRLSVRERRTGSAESCRGLRCRWQWRTGKFSAGISFSGCMRETPGEHLQNRPEI